FRHAVELCGGFANYAASGPGHQHVDLAADLPRRRHGPSGRAVERGIVVFRNDQDRHITRASSLSFATSSETEPTFEPGLRSAGLAVETTVSVGARLTPRLAASIFSSGFFLAFITLGSEA